MGVASQGTLAPSRPLICHVNKKVQVDMLLSPMKMLDMVALWIPHRFAPCALICAPTPRAWD